MMPFPSGSYYPAQSVLHRLDARAKLFSFFLLLAAVIVADSLPGFALLAVILLGLIRLSGLPFSMALSGLWRLRLFFAVIFLMNALFFSSVEPLWQWWIFHITAGGIRQGIHLVIRVLLVVVFANILTAVTRPMEITSAVSSLLCPLGWVGLPVEEISMIISVALQFIPTLLEESETIKRAQTARGARFESKHLSQRAACVLPMVVPLFLAAFKRADELSTAMEARGYRGARHRTRQRPRPMAFADFAAVLLSAVLCTAEALL